MAGVLLVAVAVLGFLTFVSLWLLLYQVIKQQGRLLLRIDRLEAHFSGAGANALVVGNQAIAATSAEIAAGSSIQPFQLPDISGKMVGLQDFRGKRVLLINWNPQCGFCGLIAPDLAKLIPDLRRHQAELVLVSQGGPVANRDLAVQYGLDCPILLSKDGQGTEFFRHMGTPVAYLLDQEGKVAKPLATGADEVLDLAREAAAEPHKRLPGEKSLTQSRILRDGLKAGSLAPDFRLPDIYGKSVSLEEHRGQRVLLVFTDPHCGPCDQLAPDLVQLYRQHRDDNLTLLMIGRGEAAENQRKAKQYGFEFPVALQKQWEVSRKYGIFATPVAFLIGEDGVIVKDVARGPDQILRLAEVATTEYQDEGNARVV